MNLIWFICQEKDANGRRRPRYVVMATDLALLLTRKRMVFGAGNERPGNSSLQWLPVKAVDVLKSPIDRMIFDPKVKISMLIGAFFSNSN